MSRVFVDIGMELAEDARRYGHELVAFYASPSGRLSSSRSRSGVWGAEADPIRLGQSKAGEYAVACYFGLNPKIAVKRDVGQADAGADIYLSSNCAADVKTTATWRLYVIWSKAVNDLFWSKKFDALVSVSIEEQNWSRCWIEGWLSKQKFFERKQIADGVNDEGKLTPGTWFVCKSDFDDISRLKELIGSPPECIRAGIGMTKTQWMALSVEVRYWIDTDWGKRPASVAMAEEIRRLIGAQARI